MPTVLLFGAGGMLASVLVEELSHADLDVIALTEHECDIRSEMACRSQAASIKPGIVINCAGYTNVDAAESEPELAMEINAVGARNVALAAESVGARCVYISTDYVFDGRKETAYVENDPTGALNAYGKSKEQGERESAAQARNHAIIRSSWLYGPNGRNFVTTILKLAARETRLQVVADQVGTPTYTRDLARAIREIALAADTGIFHVTNEGTCSWFEFAAAIVQEAGLSAQVQPIASDEYNAPACRPRNSRLVSGRPGIFTPLPHWRDALRRFLAEINSLAPN